jgi:hypothetical protein
MTTELMTALETLERALGEVKRSTPLGSLQPGLEPATTRAVLAERGFSPRKDVEELFSWHNGTTTDQILPMDDIYLIPWKYFLNLEEAFGWMEILDPSRTPSRALPLLSDGGGGLLIIDWTNGAIIDYWHDDPEPSVKHRSLLAFVETINVCYADGAFYVGSNGNLEWDVDRVWSLGRELNPGCEYWRPHSG